MVADSMNVVPSESQNITREKQCTKCLTISSVAMFNTGKSICKICQAEKNKVYRLANAEKIAIKKKEYSDSNKKKISAKMKQYYADNSEEKKEKAKQYRSENKDAVAECNKAWRSENAEHIRVKQAEYYNANIDKIYANKKAYHQANYESSIKAKKRLYSATPMGRAVEANNRHNRRARIGSAKIDSVLILNLKAENKNCFWCDCELSDSISHIDHFYPLAKGGTHSIENLVMSCSSCNMAKKAKDPYEFAKEIGKTLYTKGVAK